MKDCFQCKFYVKPDGLTALCDAESRSFPKVCDWFTYEPGSDLKEKPKRTHLQNRSLHKYLTQIAEELFESGQDMRVVVKLPIKPTLENVKEELFKPVMSAMYPDIKSTADLDTKQMQEVYEVFNAAMGERLGVSLPWPSMDSLMEKQR